jgi:arylsulfatase
MIRTGLIAGALLALAVSTASAQEASKPNILVIIGDDIGYWNLSYNNRDMMGQLGSLEEGHGH